MMPYWKAAAMKWFANQSGQDMVEYALVAGFVAVAAGAIFPATLHARYQHAVFAAGHLLVAVGLAGQLS